MLIVTGLTNVYLSGNKRINNGDGIYRRKEIYLPTFFHGNEYGELAIENRDSRLFRVEPEYIRDAIALHHDYRLAANDWMILHVCNPYYVNKKYGTQHLLDNKIVIPINWKGATYMGIVHPKKLKHGLVPDRLVKSYPSNDYHMVVSDHYESFESYLANIELADVNVW